MNVEQIAKVRLGMQEHPQRVDIGPEEADWNLEQRLSNLRKEIKDHKLFQVLLYDFGHKVIQKLTLIKQEFSASWD